MYETTTIQNLVINEKEIEEIERITNEITINTGLPREIIPSDSEIRKVFRDLPELLEKINDDYMNHSIARMVLAVRVGLFNSAINEIWNAMILALKHKIYTFGYKEAGSFLEQDISSQTLEDKRDIEILDLVMKLGLLSQEGYFYLNQCREIRNNYSVAHPNDKLHDSYEMVYFINILVKYVLGSELNVIGFPINDFTRNLKASRLEQDQIDFYKKALENANKQQKKAILERVISIYTDDTQTNDTRSNCIDYAVATSEIYTDEMYVQILDTYNKYQEENKKEEKGYLERILTRMNRLDILPQQDFDRMILKALEELKGVHYSINNFYNEKPFARRLNEHFSNKIPKPFKTEYVHVIIKCYIGNQYGTANSAAPFYEEMIKNFDLHDIDILFKLYHDSESEIYRYINNYERCRKQFIEAIKLFDFEFIPDKYKDEYDSLLQ